MEQKPLLVFGPFRMEPDNAIFSHDGTTAHLPPRDFALLQFLLANRGRLLTKDELVEAVWGHRFVSDSALKGRINALRKVLADDPKTPRYIETVARRGYRFIAEVTEAHEPGPSRRPLMPYQPWENPGMVHWVGRTRELAFLETTWQRAQRGERRVVFISGEAGIGKSTLLDMFLNRVADPASSVVRARCVELYGAGEPFLPLLEALEKHCRSASGPDLIAHLRAKAPTWLIQMSSVLAPAELEPLRQDVLGAGEARMLREGAEVFEGLGSETPLILVLEDLHWCDPATLALVSWLAHRHAPARLLVLGTYRPLDALLAKHPMRVLQQDLMMRGLCAELELPWLGKPETRDYLQAKCPGAETEASLLPYIYRRTEGHPLFMANFVDYLLEQGHLLHAENRWVFLDPEAQSNLGIPNNVVQMIEIQLDRFSGPEQWLLETASAIGVEWSVALLARVAERELSELEQWCQMLARRGEMIKFLGIAEWPDGTIAGRFGFRHSLYLEVAYRRIGPGREVQLHGQIGACLEEAYGDRARTIAAELAVHFEKGRKGPQAVKYLRMAAEGASRRYANREAMGYIDRARTLIDLLPKAERHRTRLELLFTHGMLSRNVDDMEGAVRDFSAILALAAETGERPFEVKAMIELCRVYFWIDRPRCLALAEEAVQRSRGVTDEMTEAQIRGSCAAWRIHLRGWTDQDARDCRRATEMARATGTPEWLSSRLTLEATLEFFRSNFRSVIELTRTGMNMAQTVGDAYQYMVCLSYRILSLLHYGEWGEARRQIAEALKMAERNGNVLAATAFRIEDAWLHELAQDHAGALRRCETALDQIRESRDPYTTIFGQIILGRIHMSLGEHLHAARCFDRISRFLDENDGIMDWNLRLLFHQSHGECLLAQGRFEEAGRQAEQLCQLAALPPDPTYSAFGAHLSAEIAMAQGNLDLAEEHIQHAAALLENIESPLAAWKVHETAATLAGRRGHRTLLEAHRTRRTAIIQGLAESLEQNDPLRGFLAMASS